MASRFGGLTGRVFAALLLGFLGGLLAAAYPGGVWSTIVKVIEPIGTLWVNAIRMTVIPLVVSLLVTGVASSLDARAVRSLTGRSFLTFFSLLLVAAVSGLVVVPGLFAWLPLDPAAVAALRASSGATAASPQSVPTFTDWLVNIVPTNPIKAATDGAMLPLVVFATAFGVALLQVPIERRDAVVAFFRSVGDAMLVIVRAIIALAPIGVFALMLPLASRTGSAVAGALGYYVVAMAFACTALIAVLYAFTWVVAGVPLARFAKAVFPAQAVAVSTSSSLASLPALIDGAERTLAVPKETTGVVLPLAVSTFKVGSPLVWMVAVVFLSRFYGVPLAPTQYLLVSATALLSSFSVPGVPHGWLLVISPLLVTMNIPAEGIGMLIAVDAIPDIFATTLNVTADMTAVATVNRAMSRGVSAQS